jgi:hypothetical protein
MPKGMGEGLWLRRKIQTEINGVWFVYSAESRVVFLEIRSGV